MKDPKTPPYAERLAVGALANAPPRGRYVEVCAGAGGWGLGLHAAGWTGTGIELDADASETHRRHVGPCLTADVTTCATPHSADLVGGACRAKVSARQGSAPRSVTREGNSSARFCATQRRQTPVWWHSKTCAVSSPAAPSL